MSSKPETQAELIAACPEVDILVNNNGGPPRRDFREIDREAMLAGLIQNMVTPIELIRAGHRRDGCARLRADRQHHLDFGADADRRASTSPPAPGPD